MIEMIQKNHTILISINNIINLIKVEVIIVILDSIVDTIVVIKKAKQYYTYYRKESYYSRYKYKRRDLYSRRSTSYYRLAIIYINN